MKNILRSGLCLLICAVLLPSASAQNSPLVTDPFAVLTYKDATGSCTPQRKDAGASNVTGCCASPGRRSCTGNGTNGFSLPSCLSVDSTLATDPYDSGAVCTLPAATTDTTLATLGLTGTDMTFYVTSDLHFFRRTYNLTDQLTHVKVLNNFFSTGATWPTDSGIPANTPVDKPLALIIDGDFTTHGYPEDLGAFRINYERGTLPSSIQYPVLFGLGNHETLSDETPANAQRMFTYLQTRMGALHIDPQSGNYSWDWQGVHMVQLNTWAGDKAGVWIHASDGLGWLANDLKTYIGNTTKPVMLFQHYLLTNVYPGRVSTTDNDDFFPTDANAIDSLGNKTGQGYESFWNVIKNYNVIGMFGGHDHCLGVTSTLLSGLPITGSTYPAIKGYGVPVDGFDDGSGGDTSGGAGQVAGVGNACAARVIDGQTIAQTAVASFLVTHVNQHYLDVAAVSWTGDGSAPYFDKAEGLPTAAAACRKRINAQFILGPSTIKAVQTATGYTVTSTAATPAGIPIALKFGSKSGVSGFNFVDNCGDPGDFSQNNLYFLVNGENELAANTPYTVAATRTGTAVTPAVVLLTPLSGTTPATFQHATLAAPANDTVTVYGPPNQAFTSAISFSGAAQGWLAVAPATGVFNAYGIATLSLQYTKPSNGFGTSAAAVQITSTATGVIQNVVVSMSEPSLSVSLSLSSATVYQGGTVTLTASVSPAVAGATIQFLNGTTTMGSAQTNAAGVATFAYTANTLGTFIFQVTSNGPGTPASATQTLTVALPFSITAVPDPITILPGKSGIVTLTATSFGGFTGTVTITCSVPVSYMTCTPASFPLTLSNGITANASTTIAVATTVSQRAPRSPGPIAFAILAPLSFLLLRKRRSSPGASLLCLFAVAALMGLAGCGGHISPVSSQPITGGKPAPSGSQTVTYTATANGTTQTATVSVNFQ